MPLITVKLVIFTTRIYTAAAARDAVSESPTSDRPQVSDMYRDMSKPPDQANVEAWEDSRQTPVCRDGPCQLDRVV